MTRSSYSVLMRVKNDVVALRVTTMAIGFEKPIAARAGRRITKRQVRRFHDATVLGKFGDVPMI